jgi:hypothetical protein
VAPGVMILPELKIPINEISAAKKELNVRMRLEIIANEPQSITRTYIIRILNDYNLAIGHGVSDIARRAWPVALDKPLGFEKRRLPGPLMNEFFHHPPRFIFGCIINNHNLKLFRFDSLAQERFNAFPKISGPVSNRDHHAYHDSKIIKAFH